MDAFPSFSPRLLVSAAVVTIVTAVAVRLARAIALRRGLLDMPNSRSSHVQPVPRLGGAALVPVVFLATVVAGPAGTLPPVAWGAFLLGAVALFVLSLVDDFIALSSVLRLAVHVLVSVGLLLAVRHAWTGGESAAGVLGFLIPTAPGFWLLAGWIAGLLNLYNFMDGIDGIAGLQAVVAGAAWTAIGLAGAAPLAAFLGAMLAAGSLGFLTLNWPRARIFMGDSGSTVLGYSFAVLPLLATLERGTRLDFGAALVAGPLVVWPFWADGTFTILRRWSKGENLLQAHRSHLYQRLVIAGVSHRCVTLTYGGLALAGGVAAVLVARGVPHAGWLGLAVVLMGFAGLWRWTLRCEAQSAGVR